MGTELTGGIERIYQDPSQEKKHQRMMPSLKKKFQQEVRTCSLTTPAVPSELLFCVTESAVVAQ